MYWAVTISLVNFLSYASYPASAKFDAFAGLFIKSFIAIANLSGQSIGTNKPLSLLPNNSAGPLAAVAITGFFAAQASSTTLPRGS